MQIRLQIYIVLLAGLIGGAMFFTVNILRQDRQLARQIRETTIIENALDALCEDLQYADTVEVMPDSARVVRQSNDYTYFLNNQRLVRRKESYLYLTPASIELERLSFASDNNLIEISLSAGKKTYERLVRR